MKQILRIAIAFLFVLPLFSAKAQSEWKLEKSGSGIEVYTRQTPETSIKEFKASVVINANIKELIKALDQVEHHTEWMSDIIFAEVINSDLDILQYNIHLPFPFKDRYLVLTSKTESDEGTFRYIFEYSDYAPVGAEDMVEIEYGKGHWQFTKLDDDTTSVMYQFITDPGGNVPDWIVNLFIVKTPYKTLRNLRERLE